MATPLPPGPARSGPCERGAAPAHAERPERSGTLRTAPPGPAVHAWKSPSSTGKLSRHRHRPRGHSERLRTSGTAQQHLPACRSQGEAARRCPKSCWRVPAGDSWCARQSRAGAGRGSQAGLVPRIGHCRENSAHAASGLPGGGGGFALSGLCKPDTCR